jgi:two-component system response regulator
MALPPRSILLVEDNPDDIDLTLLAFEKVGQREAIEVVTDGMEALDYLWARGRYASRAGAPLPAVVLLDINMPRMSGLEVLRQLRGVPRTELLPVVMLTSSDEDRDVLESYRHRANSYVKKPVLFGDFVKVAEQLGLYWRELNRAPPEPKG